jgi:hypothetical protein
VVGSLWVAGRHRGQCFDQGGRAVAAVAFAQLGRGGDQQDLNLVGRGGICLDRAAPSGQQRPQPSPASATRAAVAGAYGPIRAADLGHLDARGLQHPGQARAVAGGPFYPGDRDDAKTSGPSDRVVIAGGAR